MHLILNIRNLWTSILLTYFLFSISSNAGYLISRLGNNELAISANIAPSGSCSTIGHFDTLLQCFTECLERFRNFYMFSRDSVTQSCLCCKDVPGYSLLGDVWNSFIAAPCPQSYVEYTYGHLNICLRFVSDLMKYPMATSVCEQDGGDLIRLDSQKKFDIFQEFVANTTNATVQVWVQGIRVNYAWFYHDGTPLEFSCMISESNGTGETRMRALSERNFGCYDDGPGKLHMFICEIYRVFGGF